MNNLSLSDHRSAVGTIRWLTTLSIPDAPMRRKGLVEALRFFEQHMPRLAPGDAMHLILAMDLSRPVRALMLQKGETLIAARTGSESQFKLFFTRPGRSAQQSGINSDDRRTVRFQVRTPCAALESTTTSTLDSWTPNRSGQATYAAVRARTLGVMVAGGNVQLIVPNSAANLLVSQDNGPRQRQV